jgi:tRNA modification GTPase
MRENDTIVALATGDTAAGLAVVRVSGPAALDVAHKVFDGPAWGPQPESHRAVYGILKSISDCGKKSKPTIDQVLCLPLLAPRSFTGEDTVEFTCHGGRAVSRLVVAACRAAGARPATAGEFTRRAFLNGKLSLDQAEAVADLIHAETDHAARAAIGQLLGGLDEQLTAIESPLLLLLGEIEGALEFSDDEDVEVSPDQIRDRLREAGLKIDRLLALAPAGRLLLDGVQVVLAGPANVGKSSLFNCLVEEDRALVDAEAGTTRDVVSTTVDHRGVRFEFHDTAGLREEPGRVEGLGIDRTLRTVRQADIVLHLFEAGGRPQGLEFAANTATVIPVATKTDLLPEVPGQPTRGRFVYQRC